MDMKLRPEKLKRLMEIEGCDDIADLARDALLDSTPGCPCICMNEGCSYTADLESDASRGWCDECKTNSMTSSPA
jgi:hypothetical protein